MGRDEGPVDCDEGPMDRDKGPVDCGDDVESEEMPSKVPKVSFKTIIG